MSTITNSPFLGRPPRNTADGFGAQVARVAGAIAQLPDRHAEMSLPVRIMAVKAGQPQWTMEEAK
jgi:hypothetical protein